MKFTFLLLCVVLLSCSSESSVLEWSELKPVSEKKVKMTFLGTKSEVGWPVFSDAVLKKNGKTVEVEGYFVSVTSMDIEKVAESGGNTDNWVGISMIACCKEPTIVVCGVPQYRQYEFIVFDPPAGWTAPSAGKEVRMKGTLNLNTDGADRNLIRLEDAQLVP